MTNKRDEKLTETVSFETFYTKCRSKTFSLEGGESLIPGLNTYSEAAAEKRCRIS
jgi:2-oxoglutarate dehydrogenase complex dehydrogenase (E1) component-like enzyme